MSTLYNFELAKYFMVPERFYTLFNVMLIVLLLVVLLLKGLALWRSARLNHNIWFWIFIFVNTLGILEIVYLIIYRDGFNQKVKKEKTKKESILKRIKIKRKSKEEKKEEIKNTEQIDSTEKQGLDMNNWVS
uniref:DUF5652 domain-containing protein n=1 Tax=candidate division CPR3 bacterium TaxID=2268181 RepID=A0A7C4RAZ0_UNCC3